MSTARTTARPAATSLSGRFRTVPGVQAALTRTAAPRAAVATALGWVSAAGWSTLAVGAVAWVAGARLGWLELVAGGAGLLAVLAGALAFTLGRQPFAVELRLSEHRVTVGERAMAGVTVRNTAAHPVLPARVELAVGDAETGFALPGLPRGGEHEELFAIPTSRRAVIAVGPVRTVRGDPLGLVRRAMTWTETVELFVHPRTVRLASSSAGFLHDLEGRPTRDITSSDLSFHALREYIPGDDRRHVHWRSSARTGTLMVRQYEETRRSHVVVALSRNAADHPEPEELELAVSAAASLGLQAFAEEKDLTVLTTHEVLRTRSARALLDDLTRLVPGTGPGSVVSMARTVAREVEHASLAVLVCGSGTTPHDLRAAGAVLPLGVRAVAVRADVDAEPGVATVGAVTVVTVPTLADLPAALRTVMRR
ncbi:DUF58 domain-containing protein [Georgenia sp. M64]|uniref:DUF58 domain-containing protein n=1 Tax=Georgenia sp. M64 TaxID=3120520 RepID=UPI0030E15B7E